jgi:hypothetical protein
MFTESTTSFKAFKLSDGSKIMLPSSIPNFNERAFIRQAWLPQGCNTARGIFAMTLQEILNGVIYLLPEDFDVADPENADAVAEMRATEWEVAQEAFFAEYNRSWQDDIALAQTPVIDNTKPTPLSPEDMDLVGWMLSAHGDYFATVESSRWRALMSGACSSRRAGVPLAVWAERTWNGGNFELAAIGYMARTVWTMPASELNRFGSR